VAAEGGAHVCGLERGWSGSFDVCGQLEEVTGRAMGNNTPSHMYNTVPSTHKRTNTLIPLVLTACRASWLMPCPRWPG